jgi:hypothetical protein
MVCSTPGERRIIFIEKAEGTDYYKDLCVHGQAILKNSLKKESVVVNGIHLPQVSEQWGGGGFLINMLKNSRFPKNARDFLSS